MKYACPACGCTDVILEDKGSQVGIYCDDCGKWIKWASKKDRVVLMDYMRQPKVSAALFGKDADAYIGKRMVPCCLPCPIGTEIFIVHPNQDEECEVLKAFVGYFKIDSAQLPVTVNCLGVDGKQYDIKAEDFGDTVFFTEAEAYEKAFGQDGCIDDLPY